MKKHFQDASISNWSHWDKKYQVSKQIFYQIHGQEKFINKHEHEMNITKQKINYILHIPIRCLHLITVEFTYTQTETTNYQNVYITWNDYYLTNHSVLLHVK